MGERGGGQTQLASLITFTAGECTRGGGEREQTSPCTRCSLHACSFTLCLSFTYLRSAVEASFDTKRLVGSCTLPLSGKADSAASSSFSLSSGAQVS